MNKTQWLASASACFFVVGSPAVLAEDEADVPHYDPLETYTCNYRDGKGSADLDAVIEQWNAYMDENDDDQYFAMTLTPQYHGAETFDIGWLGVAPTGEQMGQGTDDFAANGGEIGAAFGSVLDCDTHSLFASMQVKAPPEREMPDSVVVAFSDCNVKDGQDWDEMFAGLGAWSQYGTDNGYTNGTWVLFPAYGSGDEGYDFKIVNSYDSHADLGRNFDLYGSGGGYIKHGEIMGDMLDCNVSRLYDGKVRRLINEED